MWVLNNRFLLAVQNFFCSPVLKRLPTSRYERIRYDKSILFKLFGLGAGTLTRRHLAENNVELSLRFACEIVSNQGYIFYSQNWKAYLLYIGLVHAHRQDYDQASIWLAEGFRKQKSRMLNLIMIQSYPEEFTDWLSGNLDAMSTEDGWHSLFRKSQNSEEDRELLLVYIAACVFSLNLGELVVTFFESCEIKSHSDWKKMITYRLPVEFPSPYNAILDGDEVWHGSYPDTSLKLAANVLHKTLSAQPDDDLQSDRDFIALSGLEEYEHIRHPLFPLIMKTINLINNEQYASAAELLHHTITINKEVLESIGSRLGPTKIFLAGFGWSGSSAVHDACRSYPHTKDMPGVGDIPFLNIGADSEPMLHQGPGSLHELISELRSNGRIPESILANFFKNYALLMPSFRYTEYKVVNANRNIIDEIGFDRLYLFICRLLHEYSLAMLKNDQMQAIAAIESFQENIVNAIFDDEDIVFFNNSVFAHKAGILNNIRGKSYYIVVNRNMSDQFCDQMRSNKFFNATFLEFYLVKLSRVIAYKIAKKSSTNHGVEFIDIMFESWIQDASLRERISRKICGQYDSATELKNFDPGKSRKNVGIPTEHLSFFDKTCLNTFEKIGLSI